MKNFKGSMHFKKKLIATTTLATLGLIGVNPKIVQADNQDAKFDPISTNNTSQQIISSSEKDIQNQYDASESPQLRAADAKPVTVFYKNEAGREIAPKKVLTGAKVGDPYTAPMFMTNYYRIKQVIGNINGTFSDVPQEVTYIYTDDGAPVTIVNEDENGGPIYNEKGQVIPVQYITGKIGTAWTSIPWRRKGYIYKGAKTEGAVYPSAVIGYQGSLYSLPGKITYIYSDKAAPITVHYLREDNSKIIADEQVTGRPDYEYDIKPKAFSGYTLKETKGNPKGLFSENPKEVTFIYSVNPGDPVIPTKLGSVIVRYQDESGNQIASDEVLTGKVGDGYVSSAKEISGYTLKIRPNNATGFFRETQQIVTYIYVANTEEKPKIPDNPSQPSPNHQKPINVHVNNSHQSRKIVSRPISNPTIKKNQLPQTGSSEQNDFSMLSLGIALSLLGSFGGYIFTRKRKN